MADNIRVTNPIAVESDSKSRVALDLARVIAGNEVGPKRDREYWLTLYSQCYKAANGSLLKYVLDPNE